MIFLLTSRLMDRNLLLGPSKLYGRRLHSLMQELVIKIKNRPERTVLIQISDIANSKEEGIFILQLIAIRPETF